MYETAQGCGCGSGSCECGMLPAEFVRVRYYFGQRLGVMELSDQYLYHAGKMSFHNARLHGFGVVCGLKAERQKPVAPGTQSTVLRVTAGAALDPCGREIAVGIDQCIDVAAWFAKHKTRPDVAAWTPGQTNQLRVAIRYRECPSDPGPAPRDPCGCDNGGCEYGRVRESFELALFTTEETGCAVSAFPPADKLRAILNGAGGIGSTGDAANDVNAATHGLIASACPKPGDNLWLCLAAFDVTLDTTPVPVDLSEPDNGIPERRTLLPTHSLQTLLLDLAGEAASSGVIGSGPKPGAVVFAADPANPSVAGTLTVGLRLATKGNPPVDVPIVEGTFDPATVKVSRLDATGWTDISPAAGISYLTSPPRIEIAFTQDLSAGPPFLLAFAPPFAAPTVDADGSPLRPFTRRFRFLLDAAGALALDPAL
jgi:hypothetical protein